MGNLRIPPPLRIRTPVTTIPCTKLDTVIVTHIRCEWRIGYSLKSRTPYDSIATLRLEQHVKTREKRHFQNHPQQIRQHSSRSPIWPWSWAVVHHWLSISRPGASALGYTRVSLCAVGLMKLLRVMPEGLRKLLRRQAQEFSSAETTARSRPLEPFHCLGAILWNPQSTCIQFSNIKHGTTSPSFG